MKAKFFFFLVLVATFLFCFGCKTKTITNEIKKIATQAKIDDASLLSFSHLDELNNLIDDFEQYSWNKKNRFYFFYNKGLLKTLLVINQIKKMPQDDFDLIDELLEGINCYHECFRMIKKGEIKLKDNELNALSYNSCYLHLLLKYLKENFNNHNSQESNSNSNDSKNQSNNHDKNTTEDQHELANNEHKPNSESEQQSQQKEDFSADKNQLTKEMLEQLLSQKNSKDKNQNQSTLPSSDLQNETKEENEELSSSLLQILQDEQQRKEENQNIIMQEGYYYVEKDW